MDSDVETTSIVSLANVRLQLKSRLLPSALCPDKDLVVLISQTGNVDKMSLWKMQGSKKWEVDVSPNEAERDEITALTWSPDGEHAVRPKLLCLTELYSGMIIVLTHFPPRISLHSIQNGKEERSLLIAPSPSGPTVPPRLTGVWWFKNERKTKKDGLPDMFRRGNVVVRSSTCDLDFLVLRISLRRSGT